MVGEEIIKKYWFFNPYGSIQNTLIPFGLMCGEGWFKLIDELCGKIEKIIDTKYPEYKTGDNPFEVLEVKEKFGELRFYTNYSNEEIENLIEEYTEKSLHTCEECGKEGKLRKKDGWLMVLCDKCYKKGGKI